MKPCPFCGTVMSNSRRVQCGAPECHREYQRARVLRWQHEYVAKNGEWANAKFRRSERKSNPTCVDCSAPVRHGRTQETRCRKCGQRAHAARQAAATAAARQARETALAEHNRRPARALRDLEDAAKGTAGCAPIASGQCQGCGAWFCCKITNDLPRFCSKRCSAREIRGRRRARTKGCTITPGRRHAVYERDGWTCRICGDPVNRAAEVPALDAPVIDHRVPLAQGGAHGPENWQLAHFYCNSVKQDQLDFDFAQEVAA